MMSWYRKLAIVFTLILGLAQVCEAACVLKSGNIYVCLSTDTKPVAAQGTRVYAVDSVDPNIVKIHLCTAATCTVSDNWKMSGDGGGVGGGVLSVVSGTNIVVDAADPEHPVVSATTATTVTDHVNSTTLHVPNHESSFNHSLLHGNTNDPTADQKAALAGTYGSPSTTNKYITNDDPRIARDLINLMSTGIISGGLISINTDTTKFNLSAGTGVVVNNYTNPTAPTKTDVAWSTQSAQTLNYLTTADETVIYMDSTGAINQTDGILTNEARRDNILIGTIGHYSRAYIDYIIPEAEYVGDVRAQLVDFLENFGSFNVEGNEFYANGANLNVNKSAGKTFDNSTNYANSIKSPNVFVSNATTTVTIQYYYQTAPNAWEFGDFDDTVDVTYYDTGAGLAAVPAGKWTIQQWYYYAPLDATGQNVDVLYGQAYYDTKEAALSSLLYRTQFNDYLRYNTFRAWLVVQQGATALNNIAQAEFIPAGKLGLASAASGGGSGGEINTASSVGTTGESIYHGKAGVDLQFKSLTAMSNKISITNNVGTKSLDVDIEPAYITHNDLASMQGGTTGEYYHITNTQSIALHARSHALDSGSDHSGRLALNQLTDDDVTASKCLVSGGAGGEPNYITCPGGGGGDNITVNTVAAVDADFDDATPAAPANSINVKWQKDALTPNNVSANVPYAAPLTVATGNLTVVDAAAGAKGAIQLTGDLGGTAASPTVVGVQCSGTCVSDAEIAGLDGSKLSTTDSTTTTIGKATPTAVVANICNAGSTDTCNTFRIATHSHANATGAGGQIATSSLTGNIITKGGTLISPAAAINVITWYAPFACTVTNVRGYRVGGTAATINARKNGTLNHLASALSLSSADAWADGGSVQNTAYAAGDKLEIMLVTVTGATQIGIQVDFTRP